MNKTELKRNLSELMGNLKHKFALKETNRKFVIIFGSTLFLAVAILSGCQTSAKKIENAEDKVQEAKKDLADSERELYSIRLDTISKYEQFKMEAEKTIIAHEKNISDFKARLASEKKELIADYDKKLVELENKNRELERKLSDYKDNGQDKWNEFKTEFNHDINELGRAFKDLTVKNVK